MKSLSFAAALLIATSAVAQTTPAQAARPPTRCPRQTSEEGQRAWRRSTRCSTALARRDSAIILAAMRPDGSAIATSEKADGTRSVRRMSWAEFAAGIKPGPERFEERLTDPAIEIDGDIAMVWSPYVFLIDGKVHHCGVDHFDLVRDGGAVEGRQHHLVAAARPAAPRRMSRDTLLSCAARYADHAIWPAARDLIAAARTTIRVRTVDRPARGIDAGDITAQLAQFASVPRWRSSRADRRYALRWATDPQPSRSAARPVNARPRTI